MEASVEPDTRELDRIRARLVSSTLPTNHLQGAIYGGKTEALAVAYESAISKLVNRYELNSRDILASERLKRLSALNERLKARSRNAKIGKLALTGFGTVVGAVGGVLAGFDLGQGQVVPEVIGGAVGGGSGLALAVEAMMNHRKIERVIPGFLPDDAHLRSNLLGSQIKNEKTLARRYSSRLTRPY